MKLILIFILLILEPCANNVHDLEKRAWLGDIQARYDLGVSFYRGKYHKQNYDSAFFWFSQNAEAKHIASLYNIGIMYEAGDGPSKDLIQAQLYYLLAKDLGDYDADYRYEELSDKLNKIQKQKVIEFRDNFKFKNCVKSMLMSADSRTQPIQYVKSKSLKDTPFVVNVICPKI
ncbi:MAG: sel1 repeat family protein [Candidatus Cloacimonetes bacterium]|nr:sel1 repeat family protein [Candidatus Cloacimonadota bacterium]